MAKTYRAYVVEVTKVVTVTQRILVDRATSKAKAKQQAEEIAADNGEGNGARSCRVTMKVVA